MEYILCSAIIFKEKIITGYRHSDCLETLDFFNVPQSEYPKRDKFGFLTSHNRFVDRKLGWKIANAANQIVYGKNATEPEEPLLISENLYLSPTELSI